DAGSCRGRGGAVGVRAERTGRVVAVLGPAARPKALAHLVIAPRAGGVMFPKAAAKGFPPQQIAARYGFPSTVDGGGQTVAVIELGGGYPRTDLTEYFTAQDITPPTVTAVSVDGARNAPGDDADAEVMLDIEVIGAVAPGVHVVVYFAPNTTRGFYD